MKENRGFTLMELTVAMTTSAVTLLSGYELFTALKAAGDRQSEDLAATAGIVHCLDRMREDLPHGVVRAESPDPVFIGSDLARDGGIQTPQLLGFYSLCPGYGEGWVHGLRQMCQVSYALEKTKDSVRLYRDCVLVVGAGRASSRELILEGVEQIQISFHDRINLNTTSADVLKTLPFLSQAAVDEIVSKQQLRATKFTKMEDIQTNGVFSLTDKIVLSQTGRFNSSHFGLEVKVQLRGMPSVCEYAAILEREGTNLWVLSWQQRLPRASGDPDETGNLAQVNAAIKRTDGRTLLLVISDHGFGSFRGQVHLNRWLVNSGYMRLKGSQDIEGQGLLQDVDRQNTRAYAVGFSSIYLNLTGREGNRIVERGEPSRAVLNEIGSGLQILVDPGNDNGIVHKVYLGSQNYAGGSMADKAPDLAVGFEPGYRASWQTALGGARARLIEDNKSRWSGDHIFAPDLMPGIVLSNVKLEGQVLRGINIAPTVLDSLGLVKPEFMTGRSLLPFREGERQA